MLLRLIAVFAKTESIQSLVHYGHSSGRSWYGWEVVHVNCAHDATSPSFSTGKQASFLLCTGEAKSHRYAQVIMTAVSTRAETRGSTVERNWAFPGLSIGPQAVLSASESLLNVASQASGQRCLSVPGFAARFHVPGFAARFHRGGRSPRCFCH